MKVKQITVTISQTLNVGNYESIKPSVSLIADLEEGDELAESTLELHKLVSGLWATNALEELSTYIEDDNKDIRVAHVQNRLIKLV